MIESEFLTRLREINADITIRTADTCDEPGFTELMNKQYKRKKTKDYFYWHFINAPIPVKLFVAYYKEKLVGFYGVQIHRLIDNNFCAFTVDLLIKPEFHNRGICALLEYEAVQYAIKYNCNSITSLSNLNGSNVHKAMEWKNITIIKTLSLANQKNIFLEVKSELIGCHELTSFSKNKEYRHWRYSKHPDYDYKYINISPDIFAIVKIFTDPVNKKRYGDIVDFECNMNNLTLLTELFLKTSRYLLEQGIDSVTTWALPHTPLYPLLQSIGFEETAQERYFCIKVLKHEYNYLYDISQWHLVQADSEVY